VRLPHLSVEDQLSRPRDSHQVRHGVLSPSANLLFFLANRAANRRRMPEGALSGSATGARRSLRTAAPVSGPDDLARGIRRLAHGSGRLDQGAAYIRAGIGPPQEISMDKVFENDNALDARARRAAERLAYWLGDRAGAPTLLTIGGS
jgi:hypothetical protein